MRLAVSIALAAALLAGCGGGAPASANEPAPQEVDPNLVYTSGAQTVVAQLTVDAASRPQPTEAPPTPEPLPTLAPVPTAGGDPATDGEQAAAAGDPAAALPTMAPLGAQPAVAATLPAFNTQYSAEWLSQTPADNVKIGRGQAFTVKWRVRNTGTVAWTKLFQLRYYAGDLTAANQVVSFPGDCAPGKDIELSARLTAPTAPGDYISNWVLSTPDGKNFYSVNITVTVP